MGNDDFRQINIAGFMDYLEKNKTQGGNYWKPKDGDNIIRILPANPKINPTIEFFFQEATMHSIEGQSYYCPQAILGKKCPICDARRKLYTQINRAGRDMNAQEKGMTEAFMSKRRFLSNIIVRGEEDKGVQLWDYGIKMLDKIGKLMSDSDIGNMTDPVSGRDFVVVKKMKRVTNNDGTSREFPDYDSSYNKVNKTPVGTPEQTSKWLTTQHNLANHIIPKIKGYDELFELVFHMSPQQAASEFPTTMNSSLKEFAGDFAADALASNNSTGETTDEIPADLQDSLNELKNYAAEQTGQAASFTPDVKANITKPTRASSASAPMTTEELMAELERRKSAK